jgi:hypothetical protein
MFGSFDPQATTRTLEFLQRARRTASQRREDAVTYRERADLLRRLTEERLQRCRLLLDRPCGGDDGAVPGAGHA